MSNFVTASQTNSSLREAGREKDADVAADEVKVRFVGTAKGVSDERVQAKDMLKMSEETLRLKKVRGRGNRRERRRRS